MAEASSTVPLKDNLPFKQEMGKYLSRPHRFTLLVLCVLLVVSAVRAMVCESPESSAMTVFKSLVEAVKWVLIAIGGLAKGPAMITGAVASIAGAAKKK